MSKISIRFFNDRAVRAVWDGERAKWYFPVSDIVGAVAAGNKLRKSNKENDLYL